PNSRPLISHATIYAPPLIDPPAQSKLARTEACKNAAGLWRRISQEPAPKGCVAHSSLGDAQGADVVDLDSQRGRLMPDTNVSGRSRRVVAVLAGLWAGGSAAFWRAGRGF